MAQHTLKAAFLSLLLTTFDKCLMILHLIQHAVKAKNGYKVQSTSTVLRSLIMMLLNRTHTHTHPFNGLFSGTTQVSRYQKGKTNLDFTEAREGEWQWHQLGHMQVCTSLQTDNHASTPQLSFLQAGCPSCRPTNSVKALKATLNRTHKLLIVLHDPGWLGSRVVSVLDSGAEGTGSNRSRDAVE